MLRTVSQNNNTPSITMDENFADARWNALERFGLDMPSGDLRRDLENGRKVLLQRGLNLRSVIPQPDMGGGVVQFVASTDGVKRDGNEVINTGWDFRGFEKNPAFLWAHDYRALPIGMHKKWQIDVENGRSVLRVWSKFIDEDTYPFADRVRKLYEQKFLRAVSIGWNPIEWEARIDDDGEFQGWRFTKNDLLEVSAVSVPSDPDAIVEAINKRVLDSDDVELMARSGALPKLSRKIAYTLSNFENTEALLEDNAAVDVDGIVKAVENEDRSPSCRQDDESKSECVSRKIPEISEENPDMDQEQAIAIADSMCDQACSERDAGNEVEFCKEDATETIDEYRSTYKGETVNTTPNDAMAKEAIKGLEWRSEYGRGGTEVGVARARDIKNKKELSPSTIRRMYSFFSRHEVDKKAEGFRPGEDGYPSNGRIAWALWGGDPGYSFAKRVVKTLDDIDERMVDDDLETQDQTMPLREAVQAASTRFADELVDVIGKVLGRDFGSDYVDEVPSETADEIINKAEDAQEINKDTKRQYEVEEEEISKAVARFNELNEVLDIAEGRLGSRLSKRTRNVLTEVGDCLDEARAHITDLLDADNLEVEMPAETTEKAEAEPVAEVVEGEVRDVKEDFSGVAERLGELAKNFGVCAAPSNEELMSKLENLTREFAPANREKAPDNPKSQYVSNLFDKLDLLKKNFE